MKTFMNTLFVIACILVASSLARAANVFSANGFNCTATAAKNGTIVDCDGVFPGVAGLFGATGYELTHIEYSPDNKNKYSYMSDTGCLIMTAADNKSVAIDRSKNKSNFDSLADAMGWCYKGAQGTPSGQ
jgi:hypothetical protein